MEFTDLSRYFKIENPNILPFSELRKMKPLYFTQELQLIGEKENTEYAKELVNARQTIVPIRRIPPTEKYLNRLDFPRRVLLEMTSRCNFEDCRMCPQLWMKRPRIDMPVEQYKKIIDEIDSYGVEALYLYHIGESLTHPNFMEILDYVSQKKNLGVIWMSTNGELFNEEKIRHVLKTNVDYINFSAHAVTEETYNTVVPKGVFKEVQKNLEKYYELKGTENLPRKPILHCQMIEQETTKHEVDDFLAKHYKRAEIVSINMLEYVTFKNNKFGMAQRDRKPLTSCTRISRNDCFVFAHGMVTLCDVAVDEEIPLGNIKEKTLHEIWNSDTRKRFLDLNAQGKMGEIEFCSKCTDYDI